MDFSKLRTTDKADVKAKRVIVRVDLNVPMSDTEPRAVTDATRLERIAPCLKDLSQRGAKVVVISHYERPKTRDPKYSLKPVAEKLAEILKAPVTFADDCVGPAAEAAVASLQPGGIAVLENLRFHKGEEKNDPEFAKALASLGDIFVGEAFSSSHRAHASTEGITHYLPTYAGPLMAQEIRALSSVLENPKRPSAAIVGGSKVSTKITTLENLAAKVDYLVIGGAMANTFLAIDGVGVGKSKVDDDMNAAREQIAKVREMAKRSGCTIVLPSDGVIAREFKENAASEAVPVAATPPDAMILDAGPASVKAISDILGKCKTVVWNGPVGAFELKPFGEGTFALAREVARLTRAGALVSVGGGGDTVAALNAAGVTGDFTYVSTAGGAFLEWLEGRELPGVTALLKAA
jgi:phosphoglycerate kinase